MAGRVPEAMLHLRDMGLLNTDALDSDREALGRESGLVAAESKSTGYKDQIENAGEY